MRRPKPVLAPTAVFKRDNKGLGSALNARYALVYACGVLPVFGEIFRHCPRNVPSLRKGWAVAATNKGLSVIDRFTLSISISALLLSAWSGYESREARLDARRAALRTAALATLKSAAGTMVKLECYFNETAGGWEPYGRTQKETLVSSHKGTREVLDEIRSDLPSINTAGSDDLDQFEARVNRLQGMFEDEGERVLTTHKSSLSAEQIVRARTRCEN